MVDKLKEVNKFSKINELFSFFIDKLNALNLRDNDLYAQYSLMKSATKVLAERTKEVNEIIVEEMSAVGSDKMKFDFGTFSIGIKREYLYSPGVTILEDQIASLKEEVDALKTYEEKSNKAVVKEEKKVLRFT